MINALTIDVEDYFQVSNFEHIIDRKDWDKFECRVEPNTYIILNLLKQFNIKATFFVLGWVAERYPGLVREIYQKGHEVACHSYDHRLIYCQSKEEFREDVRKTKRIIEDLIEEKVLGYRATSYSITKKTLWALKILAQEGFQYDSSIFPIRHHRYGIPDSPRFPYIIDTNHGGLNQLNHLNYYNYLNQPINPNKPIHFLTLINGAIIEFPITTLKLLKYNLPMGGGGYFRLLPYWVTKWGLKWINHQEKRPFIFYIHPWEFDPEQPRLKNVSSLSKFRQYISLHRTGSRFRQLLIDFKFAPIRDIYLNFAQFK
jgi:polysaccharide deacetylase family protein (PEP-CTERM system associated)